MGAFTKKEMRFFLRRASLQVMEEALIASCRLRVIPVFRGYSSLRTICSSNAFGSFCRLHASNARDYRKLRFRCILALAILGGLEVIILSFSLPHEIY